MTIRRLRELTKIVCCVESDEHPSTLSSSLKCPVPLGRHFLSVCRTSFSIFFFQQVSWQQILLVFLRLRMYRFCCHSQKNIFIDRRMLFYRLLSAIVSGEKSALFQSSLCVKCHFYLASSMIFPLSLVFHRFIMEYLGLLFFWFILFDGSRSLLNL